MPPSCSLLGRFAISARVALLWQHNVNAKCQRVHACTCSLLRFVIVGWELRESEWASPEVFLWDPLVDMTLDKP